MEGGSGFIILLLCLNIPLWCFCLQYCVSQDCCFRQFVFNAFSRVIIEINPQIGAPSEEMLTEVNLTFIETNEYFLFTSEAWFKFIAF